MTARYFRLVLLLLGWLVRVASWFPDPDDDSPWIAERGARVL